MIKINPMYMRYFKVLQNEILYYVKNGIYLGFNKDGEYIGIETFYSCNILYWSKYCDKLIDDLIAKDILFVI